MSADQITDASIEPETSTTSTSRQSAEARGPGCGRPAAPGAPSPGRLAGSRRAVARLARRVRARSSGPPGRRVGRGVVRPVRAGRSRVASGVGQLAHQPRHQRPQPRQLPLGQPARVGQHGAQQFDRGAGGPRDRAPARRPHGPRRRRRPAPPRGLRGRTAPPTPATSPRTSGYGAPRCRRLGPPPPTPRTLAAARPRTTRRAPPRAARRAPRCRIAPAQQQPPAVGGPQLPVHRRRYGLRSWPVGGRGHGRLGGRHSAPRPASAVRPARSAAASRAAVRGSPTDGARVPVRMPVRSSTTASSRSRAAGVSSDEAAAQRGQPSEERLVGQGGRPGRRAGRAAAPASSSGPAAVRAPVRNAVRSARSAGVVAPCVRAARRRPKPSGSGPPDQHPDRARPRR